MGYLTQFYDAGLEISPDENIAHMEQEERERLTKMLAVAEAAQHVPRRLGAEASSDELAEDKRRARRIAHVARQCQASWGGAVNGTGDVAREAAQVVWLTWWADHKVYLNNRVKYIATWGLGEAGDEEWAKKAVVRLTNEMGWISYALRG